MAPISTPEDAPLQPLSPTIITNSQLMIPRRLSSSTLPDPDLNINPQSSEADAQTSHSTLRLPLLPDPSIRRKASHNSVPHIYERSRSVSASASTRLSPSTPLKPQDEEPRRIILCSFAPRVAVYTSPDTENFIKPKGFSEGLRGLLRSFGERIQGKVVIRDSVGSSRGWDDFGIRFIDGITLQSSSKWDDNEQESGSQNNSSSQNSFHEHDPAVAIDKIITHHLESERRHSEGLSNSASHDHMTPVESNATEEPMHITYLRKLLSSMSIVPYETFAHPVACIIAISSRNPAPIETLRRLYLSTGHGSNAIPPWISTEYLRYYVLIHDEENDDIIKSTALFDLMKRHFGLHCHLLRLRSSQCVPTDDDSVQVPLCEWLSADEELAQMRMADHLNDIEDSRLYIHESDATAIKSFLREMVTQSIIPFMESRVMTWNDQVASKRRGISGRFMSLSKRFTGFGSTKATQPGITVSPSPSGSNYDALKGYYASETTEAMMRQLADYAFMLRDWKHAHNTYELLRIDFGNDKAWMYQAAASEMSAVSYLLTPQNIGTKARSETVDQLLEISSYSYLTRCSKPSGAIRCITLAIELLKSRGPSTAEDAANWGAKLLELGILTPIAQAFLTERIADCYRSHLKGELLELGSRRRRTAFWNTLASKTWLDCKMLYQARERLKLAISSYRHDHRFEPGVPFSSMQPFWENLKRTIMYVDNESFELKIDENHDEFHQKSNFMMKNHNVNDKQNYIDFNAENILI